jgi:serine/threonine-protein kinase HipA
MKVCPITLEPVEGDGLYSRAGLRALHPRLDNLQPLPLTWEEQLREAGLRADKMSVQGVQPKLSAVLMPKDGCFGIVDCGGRFILKPNPPPFEEVPANEALTMTLADIAGIEVPVHGLVPAADGSWVYFVRRFDRTGRAGRLHQEDFAQLTGAGRETKYNSSLEQVARVVESHCAFPAIEKPKLARLLLFCYLTGNEDMHLKNFSIVVRYGVARLSPGYDLVNTSLVLGNPAEESALPLRGKKRKLTRRDWLDYLCRERLGLSPTILDGILGDLAEAHGPWLGCIGRCFLSDARKSAYRHLLDDRMRRLGLLS